MRAPCSTRPSTSTPESNTKLTSVDNFPDLSKDAMVAMSAMLTTTMGCMDKAIDALKQEGLDKDIKVMVGGAPLSNGYAQQIGANYSVDAIGAVELADRLAAGA